LHELSEMREDAARHAWLFELGDYLEPAAAAGAALNMDAQGLPMTNAPIGSTLVDTVGQLWSDLIPEPATVSCLEI
jgi:hypothetical protein